MNRFLRHPNDTHVGHQPVLLTKGWHTHHTPALVLGHPERDRTAVGVDCVLVRWLVPGGVREVAWVSRYAGHGKS